MFVASFTDRDTAFDFGHSMVSGKEGNRFEEYGIQVVIKRHEICVTEELPECPF